MRLTELMGEAAGAALVDAGIDAGEVDVAHIGNFAAEIYSGQGHLGGLLVDALPGLDGCAVSRHEAACASGSMAILAATADLAAGRADVALVVGAELMRADGSFAAQAGLGAAEAWARRRAVPLEAVARIEGWAHRTSVPPDAVA